MFLSQNRRIEFHKSRQAFIRTHNEALILVAMCVWGYWYSLNHGREAGVADHVWTIDEMIPLL